MYESLQNDRIEFRNGARFRGTEISVNAVLNELSSGQTVDALLDAYPTLSRDDLAAAREFERVGTRLWIEQWAKTGPLLEKIRRRELQEMTHEEHLRAIDAVLEVVPVSNDAHPTSGLVEFQRLMRMKK